MADGSLFLILFLRSFVLLIAASVSFLHVTFAPFCLLLSLEE
ncbi:hypothetical protein GT23_0507 [Parageobacillus thermoglucosidasius]|nr:hypothetical protein GT23_0507 [Parageobacillus thermoglucosidasius]